MEPRKALRLSVAQVGESLQLESERSAVRRWHTERPRPAIPVQGCTTLHEREALAASVDHQALGGPGKHSVVAPLVRSEPRPSLAAASAPRSVQLPPGAGVAWSLGTRTAAAVEKNGYDGIRNGFPTKPSLFLSRGNNILKNI